MLAPLLALTFVMPQPAPDLNQIARDAFVATKIALPDEKLAVTDVSMTILLLDPKSGTWQAGAFMGDNPMFSASVVKIFWLAYLAHQLDQGKLKLTDELNRAAKDMIVVSSNDATGAVVNAVSGALPGPELTGRGYESWAEKRLAANRWFASMGYEKISVLNRTYNEGPYGREQQLIAQHGRNMLTTDAAARLMTEIMRGEIVPKKGDWMREFLRRDIPADNPKADSQSFGFLGEVMPKGTKHWSKAGWTSQVRHDVSYDEMPDGKIFVFSVFTKRPNNKAVLQTIASEALRSLGYTPHVPRSGAAAAED